MDRQLQDSPMHTRRHRRNLMDSLELRLLMHGDVDVTFNFQPRESAVPRNTLPELGFAYGDRGNGYTYGWNTDNRGNARERNRTSDQRLDTLIQMQAGGSFSWNLEVPDGTYDVTIGSGDPRFIGDEHHVTAEGTMVMFGKTSSRKPALKATKTITVTDGKLTLAPGPDGKNTKIQYVRIQSAHEEPHDQAVVSVSALTSQTTEGLDTGAFRVTRAGDTADALTVNLAWSGSAGAKDIRPRPGSVTIPAGQTSIDVVFTPTDDTLDEGPETAKLTIASGTGYTIGTASASIAVIGAEPDPGPGTPTVSMTATDNSATEGGDTGTVRFTRTGGDTTQPLTVNLNWTGSAGSGDVASRPSSLTFAANATTIDFTITASDDSLDEADETAVVAFAGSSAYTVNSGAQSASVLIIDNDPTVSPSFTNITWAGTTAPPISYSEATPAVVDGKLYMLGGFNATFTPQRKVFRFDGTSWTTMNDMPVAFTHAGHAVADGKVWVAGGYISDGNTGQIFGTTMVKVYNPSNDTWSDGPSLPVARASGNLTLVGRKLYYFGGENLGRTSDTPDMWALDLDNQGAGWVSRAAMPMPRTHAAAVVVNDKIIVLGGQTGYDEGLTAHRNIMVYNSANNTWSTRPELLPEGNTHAWQSTVYHRGKILIIAGERAHNDYVNVAWSVDPDTFSVTVLNSFPESRYSAAGGILNDKFYLFGGYQGFISTTSYVGTFV
jgi:Kelch motif/Calx-beta domain